MQLDLRLYGCCDVALTRLSNCCLWRVRPCCLQAKPAMTSWAGVHSCPRPCPVWKSDRSRMILLCSVAAVPAQSQGTVLSHPSGAEVHLFGIVHRQLQVAHSSPAVS